MCVVERSVLTRKLLEKRNEVFSGDVAAGWKIDGALVSDEKTSVKKAVCHRNAKPLYTWHKKGNRLTAVSPPQRSGGKKWKYTCATIVIINSTGMATGSGTYPTSLAVCRPRPETRHTHDSGSHVRVVTVHTLLLYTVFFHVYIYIYN